MTNVFDLVTEEPRENDTTIHWILAALREFHYDCRVQDYGIDDLPQPADELYCRLDATIHIRVEEITGVESGSEEDNFYNMTLIHDILESVFVGQLTSLDANFLLSNMDKQDLMKTREYINELMKDYNVG